MDHTDKGIDARGRRRVETLDWSVLQAQERDAIAGRRKIAGIDEQPLAGLALSGGGIRSATFGLGLLRGMAQNRLLRRFDYLSTVSGGGYVGSSVGRLAAAHGVDATEEALAAGDSIALAWLRRNGRYLTPEGARDFGMAIATYLRGGLSTHLELGVLAILVALLAFAPNIVQTAWPLFATSFWQDWRSGWWPICACIWLLFAPGGIVAFWPLRESETAPGSGNRRVPHLELAALLVLACIGAAATLPGVLPDGNAVIGAPSLRAAAFLVFAGTIVRLVSVWLRLIVQLRAANADAFATFARERNRLTRSLRRVNQATAVVFALGVLAVVSWTISDALAGFGARWMIGGVGFGGVVALLLRTFSEPLQKVSASADGLATRWLPQIVNVVGIVSGLLVLLAWSVLVDRLVFEPKTIALLEFLPPLARAGILLVAVVLWYALTLRHRETVNASSLHGFYQARLTRAYVSLGNRQRFAGVGRHAAATEAVETMHSVTDVIPGDDIALGDYAPEAGGGPIHLIGTTLNQTVDDHGELYNADRKGAAIVASSRGVEIGTTEVVKSPDAKGCGSLGHWVAISGAAASPGAGSYTATGWSLLLFLAGARLGYWINAAAFGVSRRVRDRHGFVAATLAALTGWLRETKPGLLACEALASYGGRSRGWWYLSDGGHFENTGVYALLRRELDFIVLADCGADPKFEFADLENLVRKARIDFDAEIEVYTSAEAQALLGAAGDGPSVLSPETMVDNQSVRGVLLARICYHRSDPARRKLGTLLIVKPNLHESLDNDLLAYARRNPLFPQQPTSDQFFDEAQWESYHHLGEDFGRALTREWLDKVPGWSQPILLPDEIEPLRRASAPAAAPATSTVPFWRRGPAAAALSTTLGLGAIGTLLLPAWQFADDWGKRNDKHERQLAAQKQAANADLDDVEEDVSQLLAGPLDEDHDANAKIARKLRDMYQATRAFPDDADLSYVSNLVGAVQIACGVKGSECPYPPAPAHLLCTAVCTNPVVPISDARWEYASDSDGDWSKNVVVNALGSWGIQLRSQVDIAIADTKSEVRLPAPSVVTAAAPSMPSSPLPPSTPPPSAPSRQPTAMPPSTTPSSAPSPRASRPIVMAAAPAATAAEPHASAPKPIDDVAPAETAAAAQSAETTAYSTARAPTAQAKPTEPAIPLCYGSKESGEAAGQPVTIFTQIYDEVLRPRAEALRDQFKSDSVRFAGVENVTRSALVRGQKMPAQWRQPTLIVHRQDDLPCASALAARLKTAVGSLYSRDAGTEIRIRGLPASIESERHVIELWLPAGQEAKEK